MVKIRLALISIVIFVSVLGATSVFGQDSWQPATQGPVNTWSASVSAKGDFSIHPFTQYRFVNANLDANGESQRLSEGEANYQLQHFAYFFYGVTPRLEVGSLITFQESHLKSEGLSGRSAGLTDTPLYVRYQAVDETRLRPLVTGFFQFKLPTGKYQNANPDRLGTDLMGTGSYDHGYGVNLTKAIRPLMVHADAIYTLPLKNTADGVRIRHGKYFNYDVAVEHYFGGKFNTVLELNAFRKRAEVDDGVVLPNSDSRALNALVGFAYTTEKLQTLVGYTQTISGRNTEAAGVMFVSILKTFSFKDRRD